MEDLGGEAPVSERHQDAGGRHAGQGGGHLEMNWPGLTREAREICEAIGLPVLRSWTVLKRTTSELPKTI